MTGDINNPPSSSFVYSDPKKGWSQLLTRSNGEWAKTRRGLIYVCHASAKTWSKI